MSEVSTPCRSPVAWVPTLYFAEGPPFYAVNYMALLFYQGVGIDNAKTAFVVSMLAWPWTLKPAWSPLLEMYRTKKFFVVLMQPHDIAADGVYIASLSAKEQAAYAGWRGAFYNVACIFSMGALIALAAWHARVLPIGRGAGSREDTRGGQGGEK